MAAPGRLASLPPAARHLVVAIFSGTFIVLLFGLVPSWLADANEELGWPRWHSAAGRVAGGVLFVASLGLVLYCSRLFSRIGKGTPVPIDPPTELVVAGIYRYSRNPIYVGQVGILLSYFVTSGELLLLLYACSWAAFVQAFIVRVEEPGLRERFGDPYLEYCRTVPRWLGRRTPRESGA